MKNFSIYLAAFLLCVPLPIFAMGGVDLPIADLVCAGGILLSVKYFRLAITKLLYLSVALSILSSYVIGLTVTQDYDLRALFSVVYFFKPYFAIYVAFYLLRFRSDFVIFVKSSSWIIFWLCLIVGTSIVFKSSGIVRLESEMNGDIFGVGLYGAYGVNSLAVYYLLLYFLILVAPLVTRDNSRLGKIGRIVSLVLLSYFVIFSLSREAILGYFVLNGWYVWRHASRAVRICALVMLLVAVSAAISIGISEEVGGSKWTQITESIAEGDLDKLSSGRISLYQIALNQVAENIPFANGFHGFQLYTTGIEGYESIEGLSPHNQYITALWKMGLFAVVPYFLFFFALYAMWRGRKSSDINRALSVWLLIVFFVLANLWDVLIIPNFAALLFFIWGGAIKHGAPFVPECSGEAKCQLSA